jgi:hypothetical protein
MSVENTLAERGSRYGTFKNHARIAQAIQDIMREEENWACLEDDERQALVTISDKIARILNAPAGTLYSDSWHDIAGYALLVDKRLKSLEADKMLQCG